jgi:hypothetical protein
MLTKSRSNLAQHLAVAMSGQRSDATSQAANFAPRHALKAMDNLESITRLSQSKFLHAFV